MADDKNKRGKNERSKVNSSQDYEIRYLKDKLGVSPQAIAAARRATGSNDRAVLERYLKSKTK